MVGMALVDRFRRRKLVLEPLFAMCTTLFVLGGLIHTSKGVTCSLLGSICPGVVNSGIHTMDVRGMTMALSVKFLSCDLCDCSQLVKDSCHDFSQARVLPTAARSPRERAWWCPSQSTHSQRRTTWPDCKCVTRFVQNASLRKFQTPRRRGQCVC